MFAMLQRFTSYLKSFNNKRLFPFGVNYLVKTRKGGNWLLATNDSWEGDQKDFDF